jgi:hypothetical protein
MSITIGADPEFFVYHYHEGEYDEYEDDYIDNSRYVPCVDLVPGTKEEPHPLTESGTFCHEDNVCVEIGIPACTTAHEFTAYIGEAKRALYQDFFAREGYELAFDAAVRFSASELDSKQAKQFGCDPDYDAYTNGEMRHIPKTTVDGHWRYAGGHIHIGGDFNCPPFVAALFADLFLGVGIHKRWEQYAPMVNDSKRVAWYGQPGIFRPKPYGIEYRTPSSWWAAGPSTSTAMAQCALQLGHYLEQTSANDLRKVVQQIPWLAVREFLTAVPTNPTERKMKVKGLCDLFEKAGLIL